MIKQSSLKNICLCLGFVYILQEYVRAVNEGVVPCIESALDSLKENVLRKAYVTALRAYREVSINSCGLDYQIKIKYHNAIYSFE